MNFEKKDVIKLVFAIVLAIAIGIAVALSSMVMSADKKAEATVTLPEIKVYIRGEIKNPNLYKVDANLRLCELIELAGGATENAELQMMNMAAILIDGTTVTIPSKSGVTAPETPETAESPAVQMPEEAYVATEHYTIRQQPDAVATEQEQETEKPKESPKPTTEKITSGKININNADKNELMRLPGVGEATANKIISYRNSSGGFMAIEEIMNVSGIGEKKFEAMKEFLVVE